MNRMWRLDAANLHWRRCLLAEAGGFEGVAAPEWAVIGEGIDEGKKGFMLLVKFAA